MMMLIEEVGCNVYRSDNICRVGDVEREKEGRVKYIL